MSVVFAPVALLLLLAAQAAAGPLLDAAFVYVPELDPQQVAGHLAELRGLNITTIVVSEMRHATACGDPNGFQWEVPDPCSYLQALLAEAERNGQTVVVGTVNSFGTCPNFYEPPQSAYTANDTATSIRSLLPCLTSAAFAGWYIPDEPALAAWADPSLTYSYYAALARTVRSVSPAPVMLAPYLAGVGTMAPATLAARAAAFGKATSIDVQIWQDSVGAASVNVFNRSGPSLGDYFSALASVLGDGLWGDTELFTYAPNLFAGGGYRPCAVTRLGEQLKQVAPYVAKRASWIPQRQLSATAPQRSPEAGRLFATYLAAFAPNASAAYLTADSYQWHTQPATQYPDPGNQKLMDRLIGDPLTFTSTRWVGINGAAQFQLNFAERVVLHWVAVHVLHSQAVSIFLPSAISISGSSDGSQWTPLGDSTLADAKVTAADCEYVLSNLSPLPSVPFNHYLVHLQNVAWTFLSEVEVVGQRV